MYNKKHLPFIFIQHFKTGSMEWPNLVGFRWILNAFRADLIGWSKTGWLVLTFSCFGLEAPFCNKKRNPLLSSLSAAPLLKP